MDPSWIVLTIRPPAKNVTLVLVPFRGTRPYEYADLGPKEEEMSRMVRALLDTMKIAEETTLVRPLMKPLNLVALVATDVFHIQRISWLEENR